MSVGGGTDGSGYAGTSGVLGQIPAGAGAARFEGGGVVGVGGEHDARDVGGVCAQSAGGLDAVESRHVQVDEDDVRVVLCGQGKRLEAGRRPTDDGDVGEEVEHDHQAVTYGGLVVGDDDP